MLTIARAAIAALALAFSPAALADPGDDDSATVELLRVAAADGDRFADLRITQDGRVIGSPPGGADILINNPTVCAEPTRLL